MKYRHGDVLISKVAKIEGKKLNHLVLAEGEVTGHLHQVTKGKAELYDDNGTLHQFKGLSKNKGYVRPFRKGFRCSY